MSTQVQEKMGSFQNVPIGVASPFTPAVASDGSTYHMVYVANDGSGELLYGTSTDGLSWSQVGPVQEFTKAAPALAIVSGNPVVVFISNNEFNSILYSVYNRSNGQWSRNVDIGEYSGQGVSLIPDGDKLCVYFLSNDSSHEVLVTKIQPSQPN